MVQSRVFFNNFYKKIVFQLLVLWVLASYDAIYASVVETDLVEIKSNKAEADISSNMASTLFPKKENNIVYPFSIQLNFQKIVFNLFSNISSFRITSHLGIGGQLEGNICYINELIVKYLDCFPKMGVGVVYHHFLNKENGYFWGGGLYIEAHNEYSTTVRYVPRVEIGFIKKQLGDKGSVVSSAKLHLAVTFASVMCYQLTPYWELNCDGRVQLLPPFSKSKQKDDHSVCDADQKFNNWVIFSGGMGCRYIINPYKSHYCMLPHFERNGRVDLIFGFSSDSYTPEDSQQAKSYPIIDGGAVWNFLLSRRFALTLGTEIGYNWCRRDKTKKCIDTGGNELKVLGGGEILLGRLTFGAQGIVSLISNHTEEEEKFSYFRKNVFAKIGVQYRIFNKLFIRLNLKSPTKELKLSSLEGKIGLSL